MELNTSFSILSTEEILKHPTFAGVSPKTSFIPSTMYFVVPPGKQKEEMCQEGALCGDMYRASQWHSLKVNLIKDEECLDEGKLQVEDGDVFVLDEFYTPAFTHLTNKANKVSIEVIGLPLLRDAFNSRELLKFSKGVGPVYNLAMDGLTVCFAGNFDAESLGRMESLVLLMNGKVSPTVIMTVTHVITNKTIDKKCLLATQRRIPLLTLDWIGKLWDDSLCLKNPVHGLHSQDKYVAPAFLNVKLCAFQLNQMRINLLTWTIERNGGRVLDKMVEKETDVLICFYPNGPQYEEAQRWNIPCVNPGWVQDSVEAGRLLPVADYEVNLGRVAVGHGMDISRLFLNFSSATPVEPPTTSGEQRQETARVNHEGQNVTEMPPPPPKRPRKRQVKVGQKIAAAPKKEKSKHATGMVPGKVTIPFGSGTQQIVQSTVDDFLQNLNQLQGCAPIAMQHPALPPVPAPVNLNSNKENHWVDIIYEQAGPESIPHTENLQDYLDLDPETGEFFANIPSASFPIEDFEDLMEPPLFSAGGGVQEMEIEENHANLAIVDPVNSGIPIASEGGISNSPTPCTTELAHQLGTVSVNNPISKQEPSKPLQTNVNTLQLPNNTVPEKVPHQDGKKATKFNKENMPVPNSKKRIAKQSKKPAITLPKTIPQSEGEESTIGTHNPKLNGIPEETRPEQNPANPIVSPPNSEVLVEQEPEMRKSPECPIDSTTFTVPVSPTSNSGAPLCITVSSPISPITCQLPTKRPRKLWLGDERATATRSAPTTMKSVCNRKRVLPSQVPEVIDLEDIPEPPRFARPAPKSKKMGQSYQLKNAIVSLPKLVIPTTKPYCVPQTETNDIGEQTPTESFFEHSDNISSRIEESVLSSIQLPAASQQLPPPTRGNILQPELSVIYEETEPESELTHEEPQVYLDDLTGQFVTFPNSKTHQEVCGPHFQAPDINLSAEGKLSSVLVEETLLSQTAVTSASTSMEPRVIRNSTFEVASSTSIQLTESNLNDTSSSRHNILYSTYMMPTPPRQLTLPCFDKDFRSKNAKKKIVVVMNGDRARQIIP